jgi:methylthioribose-1-phosphate isomerase
MIKPFYFEDNTFFILDQRRLPIEETWMACTSPDDVAFAIKTLAVRGAPAIGIAAAYGLVLAAGKGREGVEHAAETLISARPTAVNLAWAVRRCLESIKKAGSGGLAETLKEEADAIWEEEIAANEAMSLLGAGLFEEGRAYSILTHCNAGSLATGGMGTAVGVIRKLSEQDKLAMVYADETRPLLQGARITAYELMKEGIPCTLITDNAAGWLMKLGRIDAVIVGADRIARNLDAANKVGSYSLAVLAHAHSIPFYIAAPRSTFDPDMSTGSDIPIEERDADEVMCFQGKRAAPDVCVFNPAFDVVPHDLITAIISEDQIRYAGRREKR